MKLTYEWLPCRPHRLLAVGRDALTKDLGLEAAGVEYDTANGKIYAEDEQTNVDNIYAIGDVLHSRQASAQSHACRLQHMHSKSYLFWGICTCP